MKHRYIEENGLHIYFGTASDHIEPQDYLNFKSMHDFYAIPAFTACKKHYSLRHLLFLQQTHSADGKVFSEQSSALTYMPFSASGDYIITDLPRIGIGVMTADCLPIILYDSKQKIIAIIHAGWRGLVASILLKVVGELKRMYSTLPSDIVAWLGPSAKSCCYHIDDELLNTVSRYSYASSVLTHRENKIFFDIPRHAWHQLQELGVSVSNIKTAQAICTICNTEFYSYRRQREQAGRQMTIAWIA